MSFINLSKPLPPKVVTVELPELGGQVNMRSLTAAEVIQLEKVYGDKTQVEGNTPFIISVLSRVLLDENNQPMFANDEQAKAILELPISVLTVLGNAAVSVSGLDVKKKN